MKCCFLRCYLIKLLDTLYPLPYSLFEIFFDFSSILFSNYRRFKGPAPFDKWEMLKNTNKRYSSVPRLKLQFLKKVLLFNSLILSGPPLLENRSNFSIGTPDPIQTIIIFTTYMNKNGIYQLLSWVLSLKSRNFKHFYDLFWNSSNLLIMKGLD